MTTTLLLALLFGVLSAVPAGVLGFLMMRWLQRDYDRHRAALYDEATRAFNNARLANWREIARVRAQDPKGEPVK